MKQATLKTVFHSYQEFTCIRYSSLFCSMRIIRVMTASKINNQYMKLFFKAKRKHDPHIVIKPLSLIIILK